MADEYNQSFYPSDYSYDIGQGGFDQGGQGGGGYEGQYAYEVTQGQGGDYANLGQMGSQPTPDMYGQGTGFEDEPPLLEGIYEYSLAYTHNSFSRHEFCAVFL